ncbi:MAG: hypothetical protein M1820_007221 [Bogoriella megaspora]|nr:MAG: hypothetical protein M1820_007221 [Bogoriella megaspora]
MSVKSTKTNTKRAHRKSRNGIQPWNSATQKSTTNVESAPEAVVVLRGRGRPRRDWTTSEPAAKLADSSSASSPSTELTSISSISGATTNTPCPINVEEAELLLHFSSYIARTFSSTAASEEDNINFWAFNVPKIGLTYNFVLHLSFAVSARHLAYLQPQGEHHPHYIALAENHASIGIAEFNKALSELNNDNCGALYVSAILVCYCAFAVGPTGGGDLFICNVEDDTSVRWLPLIHGVRIIRETVDLNILFSGLMAPLNPLDQPFHSPHSKLTLDDPEQIDWEEPLQTLREFMISYDSSTSDTCVRSLDGLERLYEAIYGRSDGSFNDRREYQFIFSWLYRLEDAFVGCLHLKDPLALLVLAYFAVLLRTKREVWYVKGWEHHLLNRIRDFLREDFMHLLHWPLEQAGLV